MTAKIRYTCYSVLTVVTVGMQAATAEPVKVESEKIGQLANLPTRQLVNCLFVLPFGRHYGIMCAVAKATERKNT